MVAWTKHQVLSLYSQLRAFCCLDRYMLQSRHQCYTPQHSSQHYKSRCPRNISPAGTGGAMMSTAFWCRLPPWTFLGTGPGCGGTGHLCHHLQLTHSHGCSPGMVSSWFCSHLARRQTSRHSPSHRAWLSPHIPHLTWLSARPQSLHLSASIQRCKRKFSRLQFCSFFFF